MNLGVPTFQRAPGEATGTAALDCAMDELAFALKMDPLQLRSTTTPRKMWRKTSLGSPSTSARHTRKPQTASAGPNATRPPARRAKATSSSATAWPPPSMAPTAPPPRRSSTSFPTDAPSWAPAPGPRHRHHRSRRRCRQRHLQRHRQPHPRLPNHSRQNHADQACQRLAVSLRRLQLVTRRTSIQPAQRGLTSLVLRATTLRSRLARHRQALSLQGHRPCVASLSISPGHPYLLL